MLEKAVREKRLAHAYVFSGPSQVGKRAVAKRLAQFLICQDGTGCDSCLHCRSFASGAHADYLEILGDEAIKIEPIRELGYKLALMPYAASHKVAVIDNAHNLTTEAANALLKVLEEPKAHTVMILVTDNSHRLLPTISSRAQKIHFGPLGDEEFGSWLAGSGLPEPDASFAGKPGYVLAMSADETLAERNQEHSLTLKSFLHGSLGERLQMAAELAEKETIELKAMFDHWLHHLQRLLRESPAPAITRKIRGLLRAQRLLDQNVNSKLLLAELMVATS